MPVSELHRLIYLSRSTLAAETRAAELQAILNRSRKANHLAGITGILLSSRGYFCQVIEGMLQPLELLFETIQLDARHTDVTVLEFAAVQQRLFADWHMAHLNIDDQASRDEQVEMVLAQLHLAATGRSMVRVFADLITQREAFRH